MNQNNPTSFERTWTTAYFLYKRINAVTEQTPFDQVMDFSIIQKLGNEPKYSTQKNEYDIRFAPAAAVHVLVYKGWITGNVFLQERKHRAHTKVSRAAGRTAVHNRDRLALIKGSLGIGGSRAKKNQRVQRR